MNETFRRTARRTGIVALSIAAFTFPGRVIVAQDVTPSSAPAEASLTLPDEPGLASSSADAAPAEPQSATAPAKTAVPATPSTMPMAGRTQKYILTGQPVPKLTAGDKVLLGLRDSVSAFSAVGWLASAGYDQVLNDSPNYGTDGTAFAQRLGAAAARDASEEIFSDSILAPVFHQDPRYYRLGPTHKFFPRLIYAGTRPIIGRTDGGKTIPNFAYLGGNLAGAALTQAYYPPLNRGTTQVLETFGGSLGGGAIGYVVSEFFADVMRVFHKPK